MNKEFGYSFNIQTKKEIDNIKNDINGLNNQTNTIKDEKTDKTVTDNIQQQINNLDSQVKATNNEITQAKGSNALLKDRFDSNELKLSQIENKNVEQDTRLKDIEYTNKRQDTLLDGLLNENDDKRLAIGGEGNHLKLENSKEGIVEVDSIIGGTLVNLQPSAIPRFHIGLGGDSLDAYTVQTDNNYIKITGNGINPPAYRYINMGRIAFEMYKPSTTYTLIFSKLKGIKNIMLSTGGQTSPMLTTNIKVQEGILTYTMTTRDNFASNSQILYLLVDHTLTDLDVEVKNPVILEGDYTNKPIPNEYFEGMKSTFEDCLVTQEMIDAETEKAENLGKYKAELKVVGKNLFDVSKLVRKGISSGAIGATFNFVSSTNRVSTEYPTQKNTENILYVNNSIPSKFQYYICGVDNSNTIVSALGWANISSSSYYKGADKLYVSFKKTDNTDITDEEFKEIQNIKFQIEEGQSQSTPYEPYRESKQTLYLDEPLYTNNELCIHNGKLGYWKNRDKYTFTGKESIDTYVTDTHIKYGVFNSNTNMIKGKMGCKLICDRYPVVGQIYNTTVAEGIGSHTSYVVRFNFSKSKFNNPSDSTEFKVWLQQNPTSVIYELAEPVFVPILDNTPQWILDSFTSCTLSIDSNIPAISMRASYSSNVVSVVALEKIQQQQDAVYLDNAYRLTVLEVSNGGVV